MANWSDIEIEIARLDRLVLALSAELHQVADRTDLSPGEAQLLAEKAEELELALDALSTNSVTADAKSVEEIVHLRRRVQQLCNEVETII